MDFNKPCSFCPDTASVWVRLDGGRGEALYLCSRHNTELIGLLVDLEQIQCPACGTTIYLDEDDPDPEDVPLAAIPNEAQTQFDL